MIVNDFELGFGKRRGDFVFDDFHLDAIADGVAGGIFEGVFAANVDADAGVKLQRFAAGGRFGIAEHDADFFAHLVGENAGSFGLVPGWR